MERNILDDKERLAHASLPEHSRGVPLGSGSTVGLAPVKTPWLYLEVRRHLLPKSIPLRRVHVADTRVTKRINGRNIGSNNDPRVWSRRRLWSNLSATFSHKHESSG